MDKEQKEKVLKWAGYEQVNSVYFKQVVASGEDGYFVDELKIKPHWSKDGYAYPDVNLDSLDVLMGIFKDKLNGINPYWKVTFAVVEGGIMAEFRQFGKEYTRKKNFTWVYICHGMGDSIVSALQSALLQLAEKEKE